MASKPSPDSLIHCAVCGEDYSATYRRCPFCGAKNGPPPASAPAGRGRGDEDDGYVFDGQDLFDDEPEDDYRLAARPKGGKRLAEKPGGRFDLSAAPINWPRLITFLCSLIIIIAALIIVFTVIYPQLRGPKEPPAADSNPPTSPSEPVAPPSLPVAPTVPIPANSDPVVPPSQPVEPNTGTLASITLNRSDFTMRPESPDNVFKLVPTFSPADWAGTVTWTSSDETLAKVADDGTVTYVAQNITSVRRVVITASAGGLEAQCIVFIAGPKNPDTPPANPNPVATDPPAVTTTPPSGNVTVGRPGVIVNADGGLRVRSGPGTSNEIVASLLNGNAITVVSDAGNGWYQISFSGSGGAAMTGYIMGEYISTN